MRLGFDESQLPSWMKRPDEAAEAEKVEEVQGETVLEVPTLGTLLELLGHL